MTALALDATTPEGYGPPRPTVRLVGHVVRWTPFGAEVRFAGRRPVWVPPGAARVEALEGSTVELWLPRDFVAERGLL